MMGLFEKDLMEVFGFWEVFLAGFFSLFCLINNFSNIL
jgi:hypothetical protein